MARRVSSKRTRIPTFARWLFWEFDVDALDLERHADTIIARTLEHGGMREVRWLLGAAGPERIRRFFQDVPHPEVSPKTRAFWRAYFRADEAWPVPHRWQHRSFAPWVD